MIPRDIFVMFLNAELTSGKQADIPGGSSRFPFFIQNV